MARRIQPVEDYTKPALIMGLVNLFWILCVIWQLWGYAAALFFALIVNQAITRLERRVRD